MSGIVDPTAGTLGFSQIAQIGFVVRDLDASMALYEPMFGPFTLMDVPVEGADYRGKAADCRLRIAFGHSGDVEIELIQWISGHSPHREFIEQGREGMHHLQFRVDDVDAWVEKLRAKGYRTFWYKRLAEAEVVWAYMERADDPLVVELLQMS